jgi:hypothetical protein
LRWPGQSRGWGGKNRGESNQAKQLSAHNPSPSLSLTQGHLHQLAQSTQTEQTIPGKEAPNVYTTGKSIVGITQLGIPRQEKKHHITIGLSV